MTAKKTKPKRKPLTVTCLLDLLEHSTTRDLHYLGEEPIVFVKELKEKVEELLKEIDNTKFATSKHLQDAVREDVKKLIKKAFEKVLE